MGYPADWPLEAVQSATVDASGVATVVFSVPAGERWRVFRMATYGTTTAKRGTVRVWRGSRGVLLASSINAALDTSENDNLAFLAGETVTVEWADCDPGANMTFSLEGSASAL